MLDKDLKPIVDEIIDSTKRIISGSPLNNLFDLSTEDVTFYVDGTNGSDDNDGTYSSPFKTLGKAYSMIPKFYNNKYTIDIGENEDYILTEYDINALEEIKYSNNKSEPIAITGSGLGGSKTNIDITGIQGIIPTGLNNIIFEKCKFGATSNTISLFLEYSNNITFSECEINCSLFVNYSKNVCFESCTFNACTSGSIITSTKSSIDFSQGINVFSNGNSNVSGIKINYGDLRVKCDIAVDGGVVSDIISNYSTVISYTS